MSGRTRARWTPPPSTLISAYSRTPADSPAAGSSRRAQPTSTGRSPTGRTADCEFGETADCEFAEPGVSDYCCKPGEGFALAGSIVGGDVPDGAAERLREPNAAARDGPGIE